MRCVLCHVGRDGPLRHLGHHIVVQLFRAKPWVPTTCCTGLLLRLSLVSRNSAPLFRHDSPPRPNLKKENSVSGDGVSSFYELKKENGDPFSAAGAAQGGNKSAPAIPVN